MRRGACCESLPQTLRPAAHPRRRALPGPVRRVRSSLLMTAPAAGPADRNSGLLRRFLRLSTFAALPSKRCKQRLYGYAVRWGRFGRRARLSPTGSSSPLSSAEADCRSSVPYGTEHLASSCRALRLVRNPPAAGLATSLLPRARRLNSRSGHLTLSLRGILLSRPNANKRK
jgi:hypothetical protein